MLKINNLSKIYGNNNKKAVDNLSLEVKPGEIYGFIGHNGAGKTTTIKSIVGIIDFDGDIIIDGLSLKENPIECKKKIAYIPDSPDIYDALTGIQYLNFIGDIFEIPLKERQELINKYSEIFKLKDNLVDLISTYSHGMKQKLVIISALIHKPKLLILDEPFVGLDPKAAFTLKSIMKDMCSEGTSVFFSSHVLEVVEKLCDRVGIIKEGKLVLEGKTSKIIGHKSLESLFLELNNE
ncbi:MAG: ABC transporter ATP-binding protein [Tenericutes bacterium]|nr:ABC transporter ATP-binding protein [Bacilli bacterium]MDD3996024.1 ABC transporter ATP-binding protein [Bacilli bacterium]NLV90219.1 ABC transporter ATP-binding protein [Mycoplasmatota bacterium]